VLILAVTCPISKVNLFSTVFYSTIISGVDISVSIVLLIYTSIYNTSCADGGLRYTSHFTSLRISWNTVTIK